VDDGWELAEFADEEAVEVAGVGVANNLRVDFDDWITIPKEVFVKRKMLRLCSCVSLAALFVIVAIPELRASDHHYKGSDYKGSPYHDSRQGGAQRIPGRVDCAYYDRGGEGIAYHDTDAKNNGSGALNPADGTYLNQFRMDEGVDTSYTKFHDQIDNNPYDVVQPPENLLYVGWTEPGEWFKITVEVARAGLYNADLLYTSNRGGTISMDVDGKTGTGPLTIQSTYNAADPIAWRQWHHWNIAQGIVKLRLPKGRSVLTVHILSGGNMNLAYFDFKRVR
jgi:hypothetical protein